MAKSIADHVKACYEDRRRGPFKFRGFAIWDGVTQAFLSPMRDMSPLAAIKGLFEGLTQTALITHGCEVSGDGIPACTTLLQSLSDWLTGTFVHTGFSSKNRWYITPIELKKGV
jgi:hypothetical protein